MSVNFDDMIEDLKKEISDNLTKRISFTPIEPAKENHLNFKKKKDKKRFIVSIIMLVFSIVLLGISIYFLCYNNKNLYSYNISNDIKTNVTFNDKDFFENNETSSTYLASLIDKINVNFIYNIPINKNFNYNKNIDAIIEIIDANDENNIVFKKTESLIKNNKGIYIGNKKDQLNVLIDYKKYNDLASKYANKIKIPYIVRLNIKYTNVISNQDGMKEKITENVYIPLKEDTVDISYNYDKNVTGKVVEKKDINILNILLFSISIMLFISSSISIFILIKNNKNNLTVLEKKYKKIMNNYNSIIIEVENDDFNKNLIPISVKYFVDLIDAQQELHIPILCYTDRVTARTWFYIVTDKYMYKYELNKSDEQI